MMQFGNQIICKILYKVVIYILVTILLPQPKLFFWSWTKGLTQVRTSAHDERVL